MTIGSCDEDISLQEHMDANLGISASVKGGTFVGTAARKYMSNIIV